MERIRKWYRSQPSWVRKANVILLCTFTLLFTIAIKQSTPEFKAIIWHHRHGDYFTVRGITFRVYYWYAPSNIEDDFHVSYAPGPFRRADDGPYTHFRLRDGAMRKI